MISMGTLDGKYWGIVGNIEKLKEGKGLAWKLGGEKSGAARGAIFGRANKMDGMVTGTRRRAIIRKWLIGMMFATD